MPKFTVIEGGNNPREDIECCDCGNWHVRPEHFMGLTRDSVDRTDFKAIIVFTDYYCTKCGEKRWTEQHLNGDDRDKNFFIK